MRDAAGDCSSEITPPFDAYTGFVGPTDPHEARRLARTPDSSLDPIRSYTTPGQIDDIHAYYVSVWEKHHGF